MTAANGISIDLGLWPVVRITPQGQPKDSDYLKLFREMEKLWRRGELFLTVTDTRTVKGSTSKQRELIGEWMKENRDSIKLTSMGSIVILESVIMRGALTAINWVAQPDLPSEYAKNWDQASALAERMLERHGLLTEKLRGSLQRLG